MPAVASESPPSHAQLKAGRSCRRCFRFISADLERAGRLARILASLIASSRSHRESLSARLLTRNRKA
jgi:hypothetical protein